MKMKTIAILLFHFAFTLPIFCQCDYFEDFSDATDWTTVGTRVEIFDGQLNYINDCPDASQRRIFKALENPISKEDCWEMTMAFRPISVGSLNGQPFTGHLIFSLTETNQEPLANCPNVPCSGYPPSTQDVVSLSYSTVNPPDGNLHFKLIASKNGVRDVSDLIIYNTLGETIYVHLSKECSNYVLRIFADADLTMPLGNGTVTSPVKDHNDFQFIQHGNTAFGVFDRQLNGTIDDVCIQFGVCLQIMEQMNYTGCIDDAYAVEVNGTVYDETNPTGMELLTNDFSCDTVLNINLVFEDCTEEEGEEIEEEEEMSATCTVLIPNAFSPNGDGRNDDFEILFSEVCTNLSYEISIFNRWGQLVFEGNETTHWNGLVEGELGEIGVYLFYLEYHDNSNRVSNVGSVTLVR